MKFKTYILFLILTITANLKAQEIDSLNSSLLLRLNLEKGLTEMLSDLKAGNREGALKWFKQHYFTLHQFGLLEDSLILKLAGKNLPQTFDAKDTISVMRSKDKIDDDLNAYIKTEIKLIAEKLGENPQKVLPDDFIDDVKRYILLFSENSNYHNFFQNALNNSRKYIPAIKKYFTEKGFPEEILYFIIIESGFDPNAVSKAGAAGMFQFMAETAREYGLNVDLKTDDRFSPLKSAKASANYLKELYLELGSLNLALASYNTGSGRTRAALKNLNTLNERSFWSIRENDMLVKETREYIPQIFAAIIMAKQGNPERFGFKEKQFSDTSKSVLYFIPDQIELDIFLKECAIVVKDFYQNNPDLEFGARKTPANVIDYPIFVPVYASEKAKNWLKNKFGLLLSSTAAFIKSPITKNPIKTKKAKKDKAQIYSFNHAAVVREQQFNKGDTLSYTVQKANTLHLVARLFDVTAEKIMNWNNLYFKSIKPGQKLNIILAKNMTLYEYKVPDNTTFTILSRQFLVPTEMLKKTNPIKSEKIPKDEIILIYSFSRI